VREQVNIDLWYTLFVWMIMNSIAALDLRGCNFLT